MNCQFVVVLAVIVLIETSVGIWTLVRHEQIDTLSSTRHEQVLALAVADQKFIWDHMQSTVKSNSFSPSLSCIRALRFYLVADTTFAS